MAYKLPGGGPGINSAEPIAGLPIAARISLTAAAMPTVIARLTTLCPMFNSSISWIAATGATLAEVSP
jgi:hypothetical protein